MSLPSIIRKNRMSMFTLSPIASTCIFRLLYLVPSSTSSYNVNVTLFNFDKRNQSISSSNLSHANPVVLYYNPFNQLKKQKTARKKHYRLSFNTISHSIRNNFYICRHKHKEFNVFVCTPVENPSFVVAVFVCV